MKKSFRLEAPDGGWGVFVCIGMAIPFISILGSIPSFGLVFGDFLKSTGAETSAMAFITSAFFCSMSFAGLFANSLFKRFSMRIVGIMGGILYFIGSVLQVYVKTTAELTVAYSLVQGTAAGLMIPSAYTCFNSYFVKKRVMMMAFGQALIGVGTMCYPVVMQKLSESYGFRGSLLILAAINSHAILGMLVMQPVEWHMRKVEETDEEIEKRRSQPLMGPEERGSHNTLDLHPNENLSSRMGSYVSLGMWDGQIHKAPPMKGSCWQAVADFLDLSLLKDGVYLNSVLGVSFALYSDVAFFTLQPMYLFELKYTKMDTANIIAIGAGADLLSRIVAALAALFVTTSARNIYLAGSFFTFITRFAFLEVYDYVNMAIVTGILGFFRTWIHITIPLVFAELLPAERFASGYGLFMFLQGNITFLLGPIVGYIRDRTKDYIVTFHCINIFMGLCAFPWLIEMAYLKYRKHKKTIQHDF